MDFKEITLTFTAFIVKELNIKTPYTIKFSDDRSKFETFAYYDPQNHEIDVYTKGRAVADVLRSLAHEMVHHQQNQENKLNTGESIPDIGGPIEDEANAVAGQLVKKFGKMVSYSIYDL